MSESNFTSSSSGFNASSSFQSSNDAATALQATGTSSSSDPDSVPIFLYLYDISGGLAKQFSQMFLGIQIEAIWHTAVVAYGYEYFFGGSGIEFISPGETFLGEPQIRIHLGDTAIPKDLVDQWLEEVSKDRFAGVKYDLFLHNCNTFSNEFSLFLTGRPIPEYVRSLPDRVLNTPFGQMIAQWNRQAMQGVRGHQLSRLLGGAPPETDTRP